MNRAEERDEQSDIIHIVDPNLRHGFAQVPRPVLKARGLSDKAKILYALLLDYAWQDGSCFPGQLRLAQDLDATPRTIQRALSELRRHKLVSWQRRGLSQTNVYYILDLAKSLAHQPVTRVSEPDTTKMSHQKATKMSGQNRTKMSHKEYSVEIDSEEKYSVFHSNSTRTKRNVDNTNGPVQTQTPSTPTGGSRAAPSPRGRGKPAARERGTATSPEAASQGFTALKELLTGRGQDAPEAPNPARFSAPRLLVPPDPQTPPKSHPGGATGHSQRRRGRPPKPTPYIETVVTELSFKLNDSAHTRSNVTRAMHLFRASGLDEPTFVGALYRAASVTRQQGNVKKRAGAGELGVINRAPYFFAVVEDLLGMKQHPPDEHNPDQLVAPG